MPVIVEPENYDHWINPEVKFEVVKHLLKPFESNQMKEYAVSTEINNAVNKKTNLDTPVTIEAPAQASLFRPCASGAVTSASNTLHRGRSNTFLGTCARS